MIFEPVAQPDLVHVERLGLRDRADDRMERLVIRKGTHGTNAVVQANELVAGAGLHSSFLRQRQQTKRKTGNPPNGLPVNQTPTKIKAASSRCPARR